MQKYETHFQGSFDDFLNELHSRMQAEKLDESEHRSDHFRCMVRVYEKYSIWNRGILSLTIMLTESENGLFVSVISSGWNSSAVEKHLNQVVKIIEEYKCSK